MFNETARSSCEPYFGGELHDATQRLTSKVANISHSWGHSHLWRSLANLYEVVNLPNGTANGVGQLHTNIPKKHR